MWRWMLGHEKGWAVKNWCFWTVVLEKTLESPLACKEIKPVNLRGNQPWIFIGRTDAETETSILWLPDVKSRIIGRDPEAGQDWGQEEKGATGHGMVVWHHWLIGHEFEQTQGDNEEYSLTNHKQFWHRANHLLSFFFSFQIPPQVLFMIYSSQDDQKKTPENPLMD